MASFGAGVVKDAPGCRLAIKLDGGPALPLGDPTWLEEWRLRGVDIFTGLPNASAVNQVRAFSLVSVVSVVVVVSAVMSAVVVAPMVVRCGCTRRPVTTRQIVLPICCVCCPRTGV